MRRMRPVPHVLFLLLTVPVFAACASTQSGTSRSQDLIERDEIMAAGVTTAYEAVRRLRPAMLNVRGRSVSGVAADGSSGDVRSRVPVVYVDGMRYGELDSLHQMAVGEVEEIRFIDASTATMRWGTGHDGGVIHVRTRSGG